MPSIALRAWRAVMAMAGVAMALLFVPAGDVAYGQAWLLLLSYFVPLMAMTHWLARRAPDLLERRLHAGVGAEQRPAQKIIIGVAALAVVALLVLPAWAHRQGVAPLAPFWVAVGNGLVIAGTAVIAAVCRANPYSSASIHVEKGQPLVSQGPYAWVRHPMYAGMCIHLLGVPLALGYLRGFWPALLLFALLVARLLDEERELVEALPGYAGYKATVRHRLVPLLW